MYYGLFDYISEHHVQAVSGQCSDCEAVARRGGRVSLCVERDQGRIRAAVRACMWPIDCTTDIPDLWPSVHGTAQATCVVAGVPLRGGAVFGELPCGGLPGLLSQGRRISPVEAPLSGPLLHDPAGRQSDPRKAVCPEGRLAADRQARRQSVSGQRGGQGWL